MKPYYQDDWATIYHGDALEILPSIEPNTIGAVVTDPPYSSGGQFRGDRSQKTSTKYVQTDSVVTYRGEFMGDNKDQRAFLTWAALCFGYAFRCSTAGAVLCAFSDWRQLPTMTDAVQCGGWVWHNLITWWKPGCRMQRGRFSLSAEYVIYGSKGVPSAGECSPQNVLKYPPMQGAEKAHIAEKPVELLRSILGVTTQSALVLDPFMGSGTTLVAAKSMNRKSVGIELDEKACAMAVERLSQEVIDLRCGE